MRLPRKFIKATESYTEFHAHVPAPYLRKSFVTDFPTRGELVIAATGFYKLYVNGVEYKRSILAPYISNPDHYIYADKFEVDLPTGKNVIAIWLGNGFKNNPGGYIWDFEKAAYRGAPSVALTLRDGMGTVILDSSDGFKTAPSPILFDDYRFGEIYDATKEIPGWNLPGFDDSEWCEAIPDIVKPNEDELFALTGIKDDPSKAANVLIQKGVAGVLASLGKIGCMYATWESEEYCPAPKVQTVNAIGSGDSFVAGFLYGAVKGYDIRASLSIACAAGAANAAVFPAARVTKDEIERLLGWNL